MLTQCWWCQCDPGVPEPWGPFQQHCETPGWGMRVQYLICVFVSFEVIQIPLKNSAESSLGTCKPWDSFMHFGTKHLAESSVCFAAVQPEVPLRLLVACSGQYFCLEPSCSLSYDPTSSGLAWPAEPGRQLESERWEHHWRAQNLHQI